MITRIVAKNFQSWNQLDFPIRDGVTLMSGYNYDDDNPEGSGKSAALNAKCWCLYGKIPKKDVKIDDIIKEGENKCAVEVFVKHPKIMSVVRKRNPNQLYMVSLDGQKVKGKDVKETQSMIEEVIGMTYDTYMQTIYFAQNYNKKFILAEQSDRGKILSEIQDLKVFDKAYQEAHNLSKLEIVKGVDLKHNKETYELRINNNNQLIIQQQNFINQQISDHEIRLGQIQYNINQKSATLSDVQRMMSDINQQINSTNIIELEADIIKLNEGGDALRDEVAKLNVQKTDLNSIIVSKNRLKQDVKDFENKINRLNSDINGYKIFITKVELDNSKLVDFIKDPSDICNSCGTVLGEKDASHAKQELSEGVLKIQESDKLILDSTAKIDELNKLIIDTNIKVKELGDINISDLDDKISTFNSSIIDINNLIKNLRHKISNVDTLNGQLLGYTQRLPQLEQELVDLGIQLTNEESFEVNQNTGKIVELENQNSEFQVELDNFTNLYNANQVRLTQLEALKSGFKEVKSYAFNSVLNDLTTRTNTYLTELFEIPILLKFTNTNMKIGIDITMNGITRGFGLFSGGQSRRIMLAVDLALSDIVSMRTGNTLNFKVLDEYFKDLSESSMEKCLHLLERIGGSTILIEHNSIFKSIVDQTFDIELRAGTSKQVA